MSEIIRDSLSPSPKHTISSDRTLSSKATERKFLAVTGDEVLCHFISALRRLIVFLVSDTPIGNDRNNGFRGTDSERPFKQYEVILFPDFLNFPSFLKFCIFLSSCRN